MTDAILFLIGWTLASIASGLLFARGIPASGDSPENVFTHGEAYTND